MLSFIKDIMVSTRSSSSVSEIKGYKITDNARSRKFGIGANSLKMLKDKAKLKFPLKDMCVYVAADGLEVSDEAYFGTLPAQTLFVVAPTNFVITTTEDFEFLQVRERTPMLKVADIIYDFIEKHPDKFRRMIVDYEQSRDARQLAESAASKTQCSLRSEHAEWFNGEERNCQTKEEAMARRAQDRIRGYFYKTKDDLTHSSLYRQNASARQILDKVVEKFRYLLIGCNYFGMLFDRKCARRHDSVVERQDESDAGARVVPSKRLKQLIKEYTAQQELLDEWCVSLCNELGDFYCQGAYSSNNACTASHNINPYASRENLILFQVWNLDHQIELSRSILPALMAHVRQLVEDPKAKCAHHKKPFVDISVLQYFLEIFSLKNLKLVHIVCHEKVQRSNKSQGHLVCEDCEEYQLVEQLVSITCDK